MSEVERILYGYYTAGEVVGLFLRLWGMIFAGLFIAAMIAYHDILFEIVFEGILELIVAAMPFLILWWIVSFIFRRIFR